jgi:2-polyprenyl-3-methyl-5-hydroxy-6-metoxy-1,4-benzoquinol methylase
VLFGDVLEHLRDPLRTLRQSVKHLLPSGMVVVSVSNIAHADVKFALMKGSVPYRDGGLLDRTHIDFSTKESLFKLLKEAGLVVTELSKVSVPVFSTEIGVERGDVTSDESVRCHRLPPARDRGQLSTTPTQTRRHR